MAVQYLLPCSKCAHPIPVAPQLAGGQVDCPECGHPQEVPTLGRLRALESIGEEEPQTRQEREARRGRGLLFSLGLILTVVFGLGAATLFYMGSQREVDIDVEQRITEQLAMYENATPSDLYIAWENRPEELGEWREYEFVQSNREGYVLKLFSYILMGVAAIGVALLLASFLRPTQRTV